MSTNEHPNFEPGTKTGYTAEQFYAYATKAIQAEKHHPIDRIESIIRDNHVVGFNVYHAEPQPRAPRSDKGRPRTNRASDTDTKDKDASKEPAKDKKAEKKSVPTAPASMSQGWLPEAK